MCATEVGSYKVVSRLLELGVDPDARKGRPLLPIIMTDDIGTTALHSAITRNYFEIAKLLLENGADINSVGIGGYSPLNLTILQNRPEFLKFFLSDDNILYEFNEDWIINAASDGHLEIFRALLEADVYLERTYERALASAAFNGHVNVVQFLFGQGISIEAKNKLGQTPLHLSTRSNRVNVVESLISSGANIDATDEKGDTPLHYAAASNYPEIAKILVKGGADINRENNDGQTPLETAVENTSLEVVDVLEHDVTDNNPTSLKVSALSRQN